MSDEEIHRIRGLSKDEIERKDDALLHKIERNDHRIQAIEKMVCANGKPGLEERMRDHVSAQIESLRRYVDDRDNHKQANLMQAMQQTSTLMEMRFDNAKTTSNERHAENSEKLERNQKSIEAINVKIGIAIGFATAAQIVLSHVWK